MIETLEKTDELKTVKLEKDTWILEFPAEVCRRESFADGTLVGLTIKNSGIQANFIKPPAKKLQAISKKLLKKNHKLYGELKRIYSLEYENEEIIEMVLAVESNALKVDGIENWLRDKVEKVGEVEND